MHWALQENIFAERKFDELIEILERFNISYSVHKVVPFSGDLIPNIDPEDKRVICIGSYSMRHVAKAKGWTPGVYDLFNVNFVEQMRHWGRFMLNADSMVVPFKDVRFTADEHFMRPIDDSKYFAGKVFSREEFEEWQHKVVELKEDYGSSLTGDTLVQVCNPKEIYTEVRYWIVDDRMITRSIYKRGDKVIYSDQVDSRFDWFVSALTTRMSVDYWRPADAYVLDVCETPEGMKIVEINTINAAGFYAADMAKLVFALNR